MARHDYIHVHLHDFVDGLEPLGDVAVMRVRHQVEEREIGREENLVLRQVSHDVAPSVCRPREMKFHDIAADVVG